METRRCFGCMQMTAGEVCSHCGTHRSFENEFHQLPAGTILHGHYLVGRALGQGGFGITYLGWDCNLNIPVAIKEFYPTVLVSRDHNRNATVQAYSQSMTYHFATSRDRFLREAQALAALRGVPHIVDVFSCFQENGTAYIIMEYIRGRELKDYVNVRGGRLTAGETLRLLEPLFDALSTVHRAGLVHRDISPDNIMLHPEKGVTLLDFGAVRTVENPEAGKDLAKSTEQVIKRGFAPPEQYRNRGGIGPWTDEYALCGTIYYCLTGNAPPDAMSRLMGEEVPELAGIPGLSAGQRRALKKGMSLQPQDRFPDISALKKELYAYSSGGGAVAEKLPGGEAGKTPGQVIPGTAKKKSLLPVIPAAGAAVVCLALVGVLIFRPESKPERIENVRSETVHTHTWQPATCIQPRTCSVCGQESGEPLGHQWMEATISEPKTCRACGLTEGLPKTLIPASDIVATASASSTYTGDRVSHNVYNLLDGHGNTNWTEGVDGHGAGQYVDFQFHREYALTGITICAGNHRSRDLYDKNNRPKLITLTFSDGSSVEYTLEDIMSPQTIAFAQPVQTSTLRITIHSVYPGSIGDDTVISEISFEAYTF